MRESMDKTAVGIIYADDILMYRPICGAVFRIAVLQYLSLRGWQLLAEMYARLQRVQGNVLFIGSAKLPQ